MRLDHTILEFIEDALFGFAKCVFNLLIQRLYLLRRASTQHTSLSDDNSERVPPDPIPNSEVKPFSADGSAGSPRVRVGHRQALILKPHFQQEVGFLLFGCNEIRRIRQ